MSEHGYAAYSNGCRCDVCREAKAVYMRDSRAEARTYSGKPVLPTSRYVARIPNHGIHGYQNHGCRCDECTAAKSAASKRESRNRSTA